MPSQRRRKMKTLQEITQQISNAVSDEREGALRLEDALSDLICNMSETCYSELVLDELQCLVDNIIDIKDANTMHEGALDEVIAELQLIDMEYIYEDEE